MNSEANKEYSVNWKNHMIHIRKAFDHLLTSNELTDVTLSCEGKKIGAHKMLLSACSAYFRDTFKEVPCQHPVIVLYGVEYGVLMDILHFIYKGEVSVDTSKLDAFLKIAQLLQISGLTDNPSDRVETENEQSAEPTSSNQEVEETFVAPIAPLTSNEDSKKGIKRLRIKEADVLQEKIQRQENDTVFISDVKCEPNELVTFEDPLEDPLLQSDQSHETSGSGQNVADEEFKIQVEDSRRFERFGEKSLPVKKLIPINTVRSRATIWSAFKKFCQERHYQLNATTTTEEVSEILADWGFNMRKADGSDYKEGVVKTIWNTTAKMLQEMFYDKYKIKFDPFRDIEFKKARDSRDIKRRQLKMCPEKRKISPLTLNEIERHKIYLMWDESTPTGLQRKFYHIACFELGWKGREAANCLVQFFREEFNHLGIFTGRIEYNPRFGRMTQEGSFMESKWLISNTVNPEICPVRLFQRLLEKRKTNSNVKTDRLFLTPNPNWNKYETSAWYKDCPVGANQIATWIKEAAEKIGIDTKRVKVADFSGFPSTSKLF